jgi:hypothetical protein
VAFSSFGHCVYYFICLFILFVGKKQTKNTIPNFTVRRSFTLKNTGELPFYVHGYAINNSPCEGYGYRVLDCDGFELLPNSSRKIDIA